MRAAFEPGRDAFAFRNDFVNKVAFAGIPVTETRGRCGGMAFAALDHWHHKIPVPGRDTLPPDGDPLADYIYARLHTSMRDNWQKYVLFMHTPDHRTPLGGIGVSRTVREKELPKLKALLDRGVPQPLGLTQARDLRGLAHDHQVVAYGYEQDGTRTRIFIWDNRYGRREDVLEFTTRYVEEDRFIAQSDGSRWRGFFAEKYSPKVPAYAPGSRSARVVHQRG
jgi:hypothetical protein